MYVQLYIEVERTVIVQIQYNNTSLHVLIHNILGRNIELDLITKLTVLHKLRDIVGDEIKINTILGQTRVKMCLITTVV